MLHRIWSQTKWSDYASLLEADGAHLLSGLCGLLLRYRAVCVALPAIAERASHFLAAAPQGLRAHEQVIRPSIAGLHVAARGIIVMMAVSALCELKEDSLTPQLIPTLDFQRTFD